MSALWKEKEQDILKGNLKCINILSKNNFNQKEHIETPGSF